MVYRVWKLGVGVQGLWIRVLGFGDEAWAGDEVSCPRDMGFRP